MRPVTHGLTVAANGSDVFARMFAAFKDPRRCARKKVSQLGIQPAHPLDLVWSGLAEGCQLFPHDCRHRDGVSSYQSHSLGEVNQHSINCIQASA